MKVNKEKFERLVKIGGWSINALANFIAVSPKALIAGDDIEQGKLETLAHLLGTSVSSLNDECKNTESLKINPNALDTLKVKDFVKDALSQYHEYITQDPGMELSKFHEIRDRIISLPLLMYPDSIQQHHQ